MAEIQATQVEMAYLTAVRNQQTAGSAVKSPTTETKTATDVLTLAQRMRVVASDAADFSSPQDMVAYANQRLQESLQQELERGMGSFKNSEALAAFQEMRGVTDPGQTAGFIVSQVSSYFGNYLDNHTDVSFEENLQGFRELVDGAIDKGFSQAQAFLGEAVDLFEGIQRMLEETRQKINEKLGQFVEMQRRDQQAPSGEPVVDA
ncbi:hypothetical protein Mmc1_0126 [Magnetococcus marinus MC-1]|uniref:DUF5610 domain-containing protein n=1 Tax=Magnetococcus marinus (strain ATCC BAA-1437 / JCM 17883 / MC-1) TaxID=156889 RepID=A0L3W0_MAGMM|nr:DUF5610 domain-containing protein [Magnetococcus marinus]ABK42653.1 hypothetical protein Mmc1_0126 [Magnetococcus marinus MC-1]